MTQYAEKNGLENGDALIEYAYALATKYGEAAASLACQMYDQTAAAAHKTVKPAEPADTATYPETAAAVNGTLKQSVLPQSVGNSVGRLVKQAASDTTLKNARRDHAQFAWIPSGDGCAYCQMIAANGWRNASKEVAEGDHADHIHPNCQCEFAVRFSNDDGVAGYDPRAYKEKYDNADGDTAKEKLRSMEREYREEHKDEINARKRELYALNNVHLEDSLTYKNFIEQTESRIVVNTSVEEAVCCTREGKQLFSHTGISNRVDFSSDQLQQMKDAVLTHNHPSGGTFSTSDVELFAKRNLFRIRATSANVSYQLERKNNADGDGLLSGYKKAQEEIARAKNRALSELKKDYLKGKITNTDIQEKMTEIYSKSNSDADNWLKENAQNFGYRYSVIRKK